MVGTSRVWVTRYFSTRVRNSTGSKCSATTAVPPTRCTAMVNQRGAAWYSGAGDRNTMSSS